MKRSLPLSNALETCEKSLQEYKERTIENTKKEETIEWLDMDVIIPEKEYKEVNTKHGKKYELYSFMVSDGKGNVTLDAHFGVGEDEFDEPTWYICYDEYGEYSKTVTKPIEGVRYWRPMEFTGPIDTDEEDQMFGF